SERAARRTHGTTDEKLRRRDFAHRIHAGGNKKVARKITACRICGSTSLTSLLNLGSQCLTGVFPGCADDVVTSGELELDKCTAIGGCGLVQLRESYDSSEMYGANYGYRSSLNRSMVDHLRAKTARLMDLVPLGAGDLVLDIGSNDGTTL